jgi:tRNA (guanine10-N2)-dimethyltransferase
VARERGRAVTEWLVELSAENLPLAREELGGAVRALRGEVLRRPGPAPRLEWVQVDGPEGGKALAERLALSRRVLRPWGPEPGPPTRERLEAEARLALRSASFRPFGRPTGTSPSGAVGEWARAWKSGGGRIDLAHPERRFLFLDDADGARLVGEEVASVDRPGLERHRMPSLPYQRPVSLRPKLARAAMNLGAVRPGDLVVDPFVGTGALLLEAALLGARVCGVDRDPEMVKGSIRNLAHLGLVADRLLAADAAEAADGFEPGTVQAVVTDPPYGRASGTGGEDPEELVGRALTAWSSRIAPGGRIVLVTPGGGDPLGDPWKRTVSVPDRVHRSLTREFRVYERRSDGPEPSLNR